MRLVVALGGNALLRRGERPDAASQVVEVRHVAGPLAKLGQDHELVVVHGNGPQVGLLALESAADTSHGVTVILAGGGGIPVTEGEEGLEGVEAVVDKDMVAAYVAQELGADLLVILTDVPAVMTDWGTPHQRPLGAVTPSDLAATAFAAGSMGPKVAAVSRFVRATGNRAAIGSLADVFEVIAGTKGTQVQR